MFILVFLIVNLGSSFTASVDETLVSGSFKKSVVTATVSKIDAAGIFPDDKLFIRRLAYVESYDGVDPKTYRAGYYGGIWQVDQSLFIVTQSIAASSFLSMYFQNISKSFQITWSQVTWQDLTKPLYSALASRLYVTYQSRLVSGGIPRAVDAQASFWVNYYRPGANPNEFVTKASSLNTSCISIGADIVFLFDGSGSIGSSNFEKMKKFAKDVVNSFNVGPGSNQDRIGLIQFSDFAQREFDLKNYTSASSINSAIDKIQYFGGGTNTVSGLDEMRNNGFLESNGARPKSQNHPRVGIVLTDGVSNNPQQTIISALATQNAGISLIAVGIGSNLNMAELGAIASDPDHLNLILLDSFTDINSLQYIIEKRTCDVPIEFDRNGSSSIGLPPGGTQNCKINITKDGVTIELFSLNNATTYFYVSRTNYPSESFYDDMIEAKIGQMGLMFIENLFKNGSHDSIYCSIRAGNNTSNVSIGLKPGDHDVCKKLNPCLNGGSCGNQPGGNYFCYCPFGFSGVNCSNAINGVCQVNRCLNGGSCESQPGGTYTCKCPYRISGVNCEYDEDSYCKKWKPCMTGELCEDRLGGTYICKCPQGFGGFNCQQDITVTNSNAGAKFAQWCLSYIMLYWSLIYIMK